MRIPGALLLVVLISACEACVVQPDPDGGVASSSSSSGGSSSGGSGSSGTDGGPGDGGALTDGGADAGPRCGPDTEGFGEPCGTCGTMVCDMQGELSCADPGLNQCEVCGQLDTSNGVLGRDCGSCGTITCADGGLSTECTGEHPPNDCGGCEDLPSNKGPPDAGCSACNTGTWNCTVDLNDLVCWGGRAPGNACGSCNAPCILYHADMQDLTQGAFIRAGTRAIIEDVGVDSALGTSSSSTMILTFNPLNAAPAGLVMDAAIVYVSPSEDHDDPGAYALPEFFSAYSFGQPGDPVRQFHLYFPLDGMQYVIIYDTFLGQVISRGRLVPGAPTAP